MENRTSSDERIAVLRDVLLGNESAVALNALLFDVLHVWDDLIDGDKEVAAIDIHRAFHTALVLIPQNHFYRQNFDQVHPLLDVLIANWLTANQLESERTNELDTQIAFIIRSDYCNFLLKCMTIVGGIDHAQAHWLRVRRWWHSEGYERYLQALGAEHRKA